MLRETTPKSDNNQSKLLDRSEPHMPWLAAEELQARQRPQAQTPLDDVDEALMESFPCSDPPCFSHAHS